MLYKQKNRFIFAAALGDAPGELRSSYTYCGDEERVVLMACSEETDNISRLFKDN